MAHVGKARLTSISMLLPIEQHLSSSKQKKTHGVTFISGCILFLVGVVMICGTGFAGMILQRLSKLEAGLHILKIATDKPRDQKSNGKITTASSRRKYAYSDGLADDGILSNTKQAKDAKEHLSSHTKDHASHEYFQAVGDGNALIDLERKQPVGHWKLKTKSGDISLEHSTYLKISTAGLYYVSCQVYYFNNSRTSMSTDLVMKRNHDAIAKSVITCMKSCTLNLAKVVKLSPGDHLSIQSSNSIKIMMSEEMAFFSAILLKLKRNSLVIKHSKEPPHR